MGHGFCFDAPLSKKFFFIPPRLCVFSERMSSGEMDFGLGALGSKDFMRLGPRLLAHRLPTYLPQRIYQSRVECEKVCGTHPLNHTGMRMLRGLGQYIVNLVHIPWR